MTLCDWQMSSNHAPPPRPSNNNNKHHTTHHDLSPSLGIATQRANSRSDGTRGIADHTGCAVWRSHGQSCGAGPASLLQIYGTLWNGARGQCKDRPHRGFAVHLHRVTGGAPPPLDLPHTAEGERQRGSAFIGLRDWARGARLPLPSAPGTSTIHRKIESQTTGRAHIRAPCQTGTTPDLQTQKDWQPPHVFCVVMNRIGDGSEGAFAPALAPAVGPGSPRGFASVEYKIYQR